MHCNLDLSVIYSTVEIQTVSATVATPSLRALAAAVLGMMAPDCAAPPHKRGTALQARKLSPMPS